MRDQQQDHPTPEANKELPILCGDDPEVLRRWIVCGEFEVDDDDLEGLRRWITNDDGAVDAETHEIWRELNTDQ